MGKVIGGVPITGTIGESTYYMMNDINYVRSKSSLTRKRVLKSKEFARTRQYAGNFGLAARIGSAIYKALPIDLRQERWMYRAIMGEAASLLYEGKEEEEVKGLLWKKYIKDTGAITMNEKEIEEGNPNMRKSTKESNLKLRQVFEKRWERQGLGYYWFKRAWLKRGRFNPVTFREVLSVAYKKQRKSPG